MGYFGRVYQQSRGPWFRRLYAEEDGLEHYYVYQDSQGIRYLLSNNMSYEDREDFSRLYQAHSRASGLAMFAGLYLAMEVVARHSRFSGMAIGWKCASWLAIGYGFKTLFNAWNAQTYGPVIGAYLRKYSAAGAADTFEISDRKREYYQIDTRQYMSYTHEDLPHGHTNYGPQPDGEAEDASWLQTLDKFLSGEENHGLKDHPKFINYPFEYKDKSFPSAEMASDLINKH
jgi:hypothetical protein